MAGAEVNEQHPEIPIVGALGRIERTLETHNAGKWPEPHCPVHHPPDHPPDHPLADAPLQSRIDLQLRERICVHGQPHSDIDSLDCINAVDGEMAAALFSGHPSDGCCGLYGTNDEEEPR